MDVYKLLKLDHDSVRAIFKDLENEKALKKREMLFAELNMELTLHALAEEKYLYPILKDADLTHDLAVQSEVDHKAVKAMLKELEEGDKGSDSWVAKLQVLRQKVERHLQEEEGSLFQLAKRVIDTETAEQMSIEIESYKEEQTLTLNI